MLVSDYFVVVAMIVNVTRHPEQSHRPIFGTLVSHLSQPDSQLIQDTSTVLGGPLETGHHLYPKLQKMYMQL